MRVCVCEHSLDRVNSKCSLAQLVKSTGCAPCPDRELTLNRAESSLTGHFSPEEEMLRTQAMAFTIDVE